MDVGHSATPSLGIGEPSGHVSGPGGCGHPATPPRGIGEPSGHVPGRGGCGHCCWTSQA